MFDGALRQGYLMRYHTVGDTDLCGEDRMLPYNNTFGFSCVDNM